jgi:ABC-type oligopeptide transport system ATPase subunit
MFLDIFLPFTKIKVFALIGESGTGKSFRAQLVAQKYEID